MDSLNRFPQPGSQIQMPRGVVLEKEISEASWVEMAGKWRTPAPSKGGSPLSALANSFHMGMWVQDCQVLLLLFLEKQSIWIFMWDFFVFKVLETNSSTGWVKQNPSGNQIQPVGCQPAVLACRKKWAPLEKRQWGPVDWPHKLEGGCIWWESWLYHLLCVWFWRSYISTLGLVFLICIMGK